VKSVYLSESMLCLALICGSNGRLCSMLLLCVVDGFVLSNPVVTSIYRYCWTIFMSAHQPVEDLKAEAFTSVHAPEQYRY
jgi:hypothetical protein